MKTATQAQANGKKQQISADDAQEALNEIQLHGQSSKGISQAEAFEALAALPDGAFEEATGEYLDFNTAGTHNFLFTGVSVQSIKGKEMEVANLKDADGQNYITGAAVVVNTLKRVTTLPTMVRIIATGKRKDIGNGNSYYDVRVLLAPGAQAK